MTIIKAEKFDPNKRPWPVCVTPWASNFIKPGDCSCGYIETVAGKRKHILAGDWIVRYRDCGGYDIPDPGTVIDTDVIGDLPRASQEDEEHNPIATTKIVATQYSFLVPYELLLKIIHTADETMKLFDDKSQLTANSKPVSVRIDETKKALIITYKNDR